MRILALERDISETSGHVEVTEETARAEAARVWQLYQGGIVREMYFRADAPLAALVLECSDLQEASDAIESLPLVKAGAIDFEIVPLRAYPGFSRLFAEVE